MNTLGAAPAGVQSDKDPPILAVPSQQGRAVACLNPDLLMLTDEYRYKVLKLLHENPNVSQREIAKELGISLGKVNYCLKALVERGLVKARNFKNSQNKQAYAYLLTPKGIEDKAKVTALFLRRKLAEYETLKEEIKDLTDEVDRAHKRNQYAKDSFQK